MSGKLWSFSIIVALTLACSLIATASLTLEAKAATPTALMFYISPGSVEHSSYFNPPTDVILSISLASGGTPLRNRGVELWCQFLGGPSSPGYPWTKLGTYGTSINGQYYSTSFDVETAVGGECGDYEFKTVYIPEGADVGVYDGCESSTDTLTITPRSIQSTTCEITFTPTTYTHSSFSQQPEEGTLFLSLKSGGLPLPGRMLQIDYRRIGVGSWNSVGPASTDGNGEFSTEVPPEMMVSGGDPGEYVIRATYTPSGNDIADFSGSSDTCTITINPHPLEATSVSFAISPNVVEHSSYAQPPDESTLSIELSSGGTGLGGRLVVIYYRALGASTWSSFAPATLDGSGRFTVSGPLEMIVPGGVCGTYEFKAAYEAPYPDSTDYLPSEDTCTVTINPPSTETSVVSISGHSGSTSHSSTTGVTVRITGSSLADGFQFTVSSQKHGTAPPTGTAYFLAASNLFYDVQVLPVGGSAGPDVTATVSITDSSIVSGCLVSYYTGTTWLSVSASFVSPHTVTFTVPVSMLTGTPFVVYTLPLFVVPEYPLGALLSFGACFAALITLTGVRKRKITR